MPGSCQRTAIAYCRAVTHRPSWQARSRRTLRFIDRDVEREYQASAAVSTAQLRAGRLIAVGLWLVGGLLTPWVTHVVATPVYAIAGAMAIANLVGAALAPRATTLDRQQFVGTTLNVLAGIAVLFLAVLTDRFDQYAAPGVMLIGVFAFIVLRLQFTFA
jgi:cation transport ATPase